MACQNLDCKFGYIVFSIPSENIYFVERKAFK